MSNNDPTETSTTLALKLIEILELPKRVTNLTLHFKPRQAVVADVTYYPNIKGELAVTERFICTPVVDAPELAQAPAQQGQAATQTAAQGV